MASPNSTFTEIVTTTLANYSRTMADNITNNNALLKSISEKGNKIVAGGRTIVQELEYAQNGTAKWYSGYEVLDTSTSNTFTAAEFNYKQLAGNVVISGLEQVENSGKEQVFNLLKSRVRNLQSIGRVLRKSENKTKATLFDIADDITFNKRRNYTLNHLVERIKIYKEEKFNYEVINVALSQ